MLSCKSMLLKYVRILRKTRHYKSKKGISSARFLEWDGIPAINHKSGKFQTFCERKSPAASICFSAPMVTAAMIIPILRLIVANNIRFVCEAHNVIGAYGTYHSAVA